MEICEYDFKYRIKFTLKLYYRILQFYNLFEYFKVYKIDFV